VKLIKGGSGICAAEPEASAVFVDLELQASKQPSESDCHSSTPKTECPDPAPGERAQQASLKGCVAQGCKENRLGMVLLMALMSTSIGMTVFRITFPGADTMTMIGSLFVATNSTSASTPGAEREQVGEPSTSTSVMPSQSLSPSPSPPSPLPPHLSSLSPSPSPPPPRLSSSSPSPLLSPPSPSPRPPSPVPVPPLLVSSPQPLGPPPRSPPRPPSPLPSSPLSHPQPPQPPAIPPDEGVVYDLYTGWDSYRIGDMFAVTQYREDRCNDAECPIEWWRYSNQADYHCGTWPTSLACRYLQATSDESNFHVLAWLVGMTSPGLAPVADSAVVHLRVGDVFSENYARLRDMSTEQILQGPLICVPGVFSDAQHGGALRHCYVMNLAYYEEQVRRLPAHVRVIYLVGGSHYREGFWESSQYIRAVRAFFVSRGFWVQLRLGGNPDEDIVFMSRASYFIQGGGGYSLLLAGLVRQMNGTVLNYLPSCRSDICGDTGNDCCAPEGTWDRSCTVGGYFVQTAPRYERDFCTETFGEGVRFECCPVSPNPATGR